MAAFKSHCAFGFRRGSLLKIEIKRDKAMGQFGRIGSLANLPGNKAFARLVKTAMMLQEAGATSPARAKPVAQKVLVVPG